MVGVTGFEPATPCTPCKYSTRLSYTPNNASILTQPEKNYNNFLFKHLYLNITPLLPAIFFSFCINKKINSNCYNQLILWENARIVVPTTIRYHLLVRTNNNNKTKETKMSKSENKNGKCKNCSNTHDGGYNKKTECNKKMFDK